MNDPSDDGVNNGNKWPLEGSNATNTFQSQQQQQQPYQPTILNTLLTQAQPQHFQFPPGVLQQSSNHGQETARHLLHSLVPLMQQTVQSENLSNVMQLQATIRILQDQPQLMAALSIMLQSQQQQTEQQQEQQQFPQQSMQMPKEHYSTQPRTTTSSGEEASSSSSDVAVTASSWDNNNNSNSYTDTQNRLEDTTSNDDAVEVKTTTSSTSSSNVSNIASSSKAPPCDPIASQIQLRGSSKTSTDMGDKDEDDEYDNDGGDEGEEGGGESDETEVGDKKADHVSITFGRGSYTKIACRARGMPMSHNPLTAFFLIPGSIKHGDDVICSHPACREAGVKFRYCSFCEAPVAKRNFGRRHTHAGEKLLSKQDKISDDATTSTDAAVAPSAGRAKRKVQQSEGSSAKKGRLKEPGIPDSIGNHGSNDTPSSEETDSTSGSGTDVQQSDGANSQEAAPRDFDQARWDAWISLLKKRPEASDKRAMSIWVRKVLVVSDTQLPLSKLDDVSVSTEEEKGKHINEKNGNGSGSDSAE